MSAPRLPPLVTMETMPPASSVAATTRPAAPEGASPAKRFSAPPQKAWQTTYRLRAADSAPEPIFQILNAIPSFCLGRTGAAGW